MYLLKFTKNVVFEPILIYFSKLNFRTQFDCTTSARRTNQSEYPAWAVGRQCLRIACNGLV